MLLRPPVRLFDPSIKNYFQYAFPRSVIKKYKVINYFSYRYFLKIFKKQVIITTIKFQHFCV